MNKTTKKLLSFALAATIMSGVPVVSHAEEDVKEESIEYVVKKGDTLGKIANNYGVAVEDLKAVNGLKSDEIRIGQELIIPDMKI